MSSTAFFQRLRPERVLPVLATRPTRIWLALLILLVLTACNRPSGAELTPTINVTQAYQTVEARLTQAAAETPTLTPSPGPTESGLASTTPTDTPSSSPTASPITPSPESSAGCDAAAAGNPIDVTVPDDAKMLPGEVFTKKWRLVNVGSCAWTQGYAAIYFSGEMMGAPSQVNLQKEVQPGETVEISVDMVAPTRPGSYQSNWKLRNANGALFGIGPGADSPFWVRITVVDVPTPTSTESAEPSPTPTPSASPEVLVQGDVTLLSDYRVDLDSLDLNAGVGEDLLFHKNEAGTHLLSPQTGALLGVFGGSQPTQDACQAANLSRASLPLESIPPATYFCFLTDQNRYGWMQLVSFSPADSSLELQILTWAAP